jgi:hypothetical protein
MRREIPEKMQVGSPIAPATFLDQNGEAVELYDLLGTGTPLLLLLGRSSIVLPPGRWAGGDTTNVFDLPADSTLEIIAGGRAGFLSVVDRSFHDFDPTPIPPNQAEVDFVCDQLTVWCFRDAFWTLYTQSDHSAEGTWIVLDEDAVIRAMVIEDFTTSLDLSPIDSVLSALVDP